MPLDSKVAEIILEDNITDNINTIPIENPPDFIDEILPFHEFLSISTLGAKSNSDIYVDKSKYQDTCTDYSIDDCEIDTIYSSPFIRTLQTVLPYSKHKNLNLMFG